VLRNGGDNVTRTADFLTGLTDFIAVLGTERSEKSATERFFKAGREQAGGPEASVGNSQKQIFQRPTRPRTGCDDNGGDTKHHPKHPLVSADVVVVNPLWHFLH
jgi:hypothetical protein